MESKPSQAFGGAQGSLTFVRQRGGCLAVVTGKQGQVARQRIFCVFPGWEVPHTHKHAPSFKKGNPLFCNSKPCQP